MKYKHNQSECKKFLKDVCKIVPRKDGKGYIALKSTPTIYSTSTYKDYRDSINYHSQGINISNKNAEKWYWILEDITSYDDLPNCFCGKKVSFLTLKEGYSVGCCRGHASSTELKRKKTEMTAMMDNPIDKTPPLTKKQVMSIITEFGFDVRKYKKFYAIQGMYINIDLYRSVLYYTSFIPKRGKIITRFLEGCFCLLSNLEEVPKCKTKGCNNPVNFKAMGKSKYSGYAKYCSVRCIHQDEELLRRVGELNIERYGEAVACNTKKNLAKKRRKQAKKGYWDKIVEKRIETNLEKYGYEHTCQVAEFKKKQYKTNIERYGYAIPVHNSKMFINKIHKCGIRYQGSFEKRFIDEWIRENPIDSIMTGPTVHYSLNGVGHIYHVDFEIIEKDSIHRLIEVKGSHKWFFEDIESGKLQEKINALWIYSQGGKYLEPLIIFNGVRKTSNEMLEDINRYLSNPDKQSARKILGGDKHKFIRS